MPTHTDPRTPVCHRCTRAIVDNDYDLSTFPGMDRADLTGIIDRADLLGADLTECRTGADCYICRETIAQADDHIGECNGEPVPMRTIRVFVDLTEPGLAWDEGTGDDMSSGAYGPLSPHIDDARADLARVARSAFGAWTIDELTAYAFDPNDRCLTITGPANHPLIACAQ